MKIISIITARGGSKRLLGKNIKPILGKPLIGYTIEAAIESNRFDCVIVSTDDEDIAKVSKNFNAEIIMRPANLAQDDTPTMDVIFHVMNQLKKHFDTSTIIILLQPTTPLRTVEDITKSLDLFLNNKCESVISVCNVLKNPFWCLKIEKGYLEPIFEKKYFNIRKENLYNLNGAIYIAKLKTLQKYQSFLCKYTIPYIMPTKRSIDIDTEFDFMLAEFFLRKRLGIT